jgi:hypothetical protein
MPMNKSNQLDEDTYKIITKTRQLKEILTF